MNITTIPNIREISFFQHFESKKSERHKKIIHRTLLARDTWKPEGINSQYKGQVHPKSPACHLAKPGNSQS